MRELEDKRPLPIQTGQTMDSRHALAEVGGSPVAWVSHLVNLNAQLGCIDSRVLPNGDNSLNPQNPNQLNIELARNRKLMSGEFSVCKLIPIHIRMKWEYIPKHGRSAYLTQN
ncbi:hypothetical protein [Stenotrophomonas maltophilia]|uniref:hypothetical protein n=1 Tax=Stenotrophomonas maltophilia TaxID=40324 RepID=UPI0012AF229F|nr:hypothetical protein [Stenotrophomonas maltophilia]MBH1457169.1 hypothetical protein [Stenotrophomonas maltophilia]MBH1539305.1 hypothetical protein [Stenotrophomonas maltophilia]MBH1598691.1 hypothetical protein [Stenotrophomonas maltophilia]MBH1781966.1 hypothetical protein [Stenotrophomonas maltophilia]MBN5046525.1 hypothetical protein [Stenotrophomonas maltophilia]